MASMLRSLIGTPMRLAFAMPGDARLRPMNIEHSSNCERHTFIRRSVPMLPLPRMATRSLVMLTYAISGVLVTR